MHNKIVQKRFKCQLKCKSGNIQHNETHEQLLYTYAQPIQVQQICNPHLCLLVWKSRWKAAAGRTVHWSCTYTHTQAYMVIAKFLRFGAGMWKKGTISEEMWHFGRKSECTQMDAPPQLPFCSFSSSFVPEHFLQLQVAL